MTEGGELAECGDLSCEIGQERRISGHRESEVLSLKMRTQE
jgi:hypothetical protein